MWESAGSREGYTSKRKWQHSVNGRGERPPASKRVRDPVLRSNYPEAWGAVERGQFCKKCEAWRGCLGLEPRFELYIDHLVTVFEEVRRVLRSDGTLWLNLGDCYHNGDKGGYERDRVKATDSLQANHQASNFAGQPNRMPQPGLKPKDLVGMPWRVALALQADGWWLRSDIIWAKPNPMPESVKDRPTRAHEYVFLLTKSERYFYDANAIREPVIVPGRRSGNKQRHLADGKHGRLNTHLGSSVPWRDTGQGRNRRSVWTITVQPFKGAHFATFPERLAALCILAGTSDKGCCSRCGRPSRRVVKNGPPNRAWLRYCGADASGTYSGKALKDYRHAGAQNPAAVKARILAGMANRVTSGWKSDCECNAGDPIPCTVLDPFAGAGTTGVVATRLNRRFIGIELNTGYVAMADGRIRQAPRTARGGVFGRAADA